MPTRTKISVADLKSAARLLAKGHLFEDFSVGRVFEHHWGRTLSQAENSLFSSLTLHFNPHYFNSMHAAEHGHPVILLNPLLIFNTVFGLSVEDLSEAGMGPFLGVDKLTYHQPGYVGDTLNARSTVVEKRDSSKRPEFGIVTWHTEGFNQKGVRLIDFQRANLVTRRNTT